MGAGTLERQLGGKQRTQVIVGLACVLALSSADVATVGASAVELRHGLHITNTDIGLLVTTTALVGGLASLPFGVLADRVCRTKMLGGAIALWAGAMVGSAAVQSFGQLLGMRILLGAVTAAAGPFVASLVGDYFAGSERGRIYGYILAGELVGAGFGFGVAGDIAAISWRASFLVLAFPAVVLAAFVARLPEPNRGTTQPLVSDGGGGGADGEDDDVRELALAAEPRPAERPGPPRGRGLRHTIRIARYILGVRTNVLLIAASASGYYFLSGAETFGVEFVRFQYGVSQAAANPLLLLVGIGTVAGVLAGGSVADSLVHRGFLTARIIVSAAAALLAAAAFLPAILTREATTAVLLLFIAGFGLAAQNPPLDAARLDIMPSALWGRAESVRTVVRTFAQALAPLVFGAVSDYVFGGRRTGLEATFLVMLLPLLGSAYILYRARTSYVADVSAAALQEARC